MQAHFIKNFFAAWLEGTAHIRSDCENTAALLYLLNYMNNVETEKQKQHAMRQTTKLRQATSSGKPLQPGAPKSA